MKQKIEVKKWRVYWIWDFKLLKIYNMKENIFIIIYISIMFFVFIILPTAIIDKKFKDLNIKIENLNNETNR